MLLKKAIKLIAWYCEKHKCDYKCKLYHDGECICMTAPCDWEELIEPKE